MPQATIFCKTEIIASSQRELHDMIADTIERLEEIGQMHGASKAIIADKNDRLPKELKRRLWSD